MARKKSGKNTDSAQKAAERGVISTLFVRLVQILFFFALTLLFSIIIEWMGIAFNFWGEPGVLHSETMLERELQYLNDDFKRSAVVNDTREFAKSFSEAIYKWIFVKTSLESLILWSAKPPDPTIKFKTCEGFRCLFSLDMDYTLYKMQLFAYAFFVGIKEYVLASILITQVFAVRIAVLILSFPAFIFLGTIALVKGLVHREIRKWCVGRESSFVYHWAKPFILPSLIAPWVIYLASPFSIHPNYIVLPFACIFSLSIMLMAAWFKKYL